MDKFKANLFGKMAGGQEATSPEMTMDEAMGYMQPRYFTRGRNMFSQIKDTSINIDMLTSSILKK